MDGLKISWSLFSSVRLWCINHVGIGNMYGQIMHCDKETCGSVSLITIVVNISKGHNYLTNKKANHRSVCSKHQ